MRYVNGIASDGEWFLARGPSVIVRARQDLRDDKPPVPIEITAEEAPQWSEYLAVLEAVGPLERFTAEEEEAKSMSDNLIAQLIPHQGCAITHRDGAIEIAGSAMNWVMSAAIAPLVCHPGKPSRAFRPGKNYGLVRPLLERHHRQQATN